MNGLLEPTSKKGRTDSMEMIGMIYLDLTWDLMLTGLLSLQLELFMQENVERFFPSDFSLASFVQMI